MCILYHSSRSAVFFFFSSRRRHTRCSRDWSSDVCSSDLPAGRTDYRCIRVNREVFTCRNRDRKSTRLNSSHGYISYAVFCLKKKKKNNIRNSTNHRQTITVITSVRRALIKIDVVTTVVTQ